MSQTRAGRSTIARLLGNARKALYLGDFEVYDGCVWNAGYVAEFQEWPTQAQMARMQLALARTMQRLAFTGGY